MTSHRYRYGLALVVALLLSVSLPVGAQAVPKRSPTKGDLEVRRISTAIVALHRESPELIGFKDYAQIATNAFGNRSQDDAELLAGRLYLDAAKLAGDFDPLTAKVIRDRVRAMLTSAQPVDRLNRAHFDAMLAETKQRSAESVWYARNLRFAKDLYRFFGWQNEWNDLPCLVDGVEMDSSWCRALLENGAADFSFPPP